MSQEFNMGKLGVVAPFKALEGTVTITKTAGVGGSKLEPVLSAQLQKGDIVELGVNTSDSNKVLGFTVQPLASGIPIGIVYNDGKWTEGEPRTNYTQAQAISGDMLREFGIETIFKKIITLPAKNSEGITAGLYCVLSADGVKKSASSGSTATNIIALADQDSTANRVVVGFI